MQDTKLFVKELYPQEINHPEITNPNPTTSITCGVCGTVSKRIFNVGTKLGDEYVVRCVQRDDAGQQCLNRFNVVYSLRSIGKISGNI